MFKSRAEVGGTKSGVPRISQRFLRSASMLSTTTPTKEGGLISKFAGKTTAKGVSQYLTGVGNARKGGLSARYIKGEFKQAKTQAQGNANKKRFEKEMEKFQGRKKLNEFGGQDTRAIRSQIVKRLKDMSDTQANTIFGPKNGAKIRDELIAKYGRKDAGGGKGDKGIYVKNKDTGKMEYVRPKAMGGREGGAAVSERGRFSGMARNVRSTRSEAATRREAGRKAAREEATKKKGENATKNLENRFGGKNKPAPTKNEPAPKGKLTAAEVKAALEKAGVKKNEPASSPAKVAPKAPAAAKPATPKTPAPAKPAATPAQKAPVVSTKAIRTMKPAEIKAEIKSLTKQKDDHVKQSGLKTPDARQVNNIMGTRLANLKDALKK